MADNKTLLITGGVSTTVQADYTPSDLAPNNYLTIIWKDRQGKQYNSLDINDKEALQFTNDLNNAIEQGITSEDVSYIGSTRYVNVESIAKYLAQNMIESSPKRTIVNGFIGLLTGSQKELDDSTKNLIISIFGEVAEKTARTFGFSDPHEIFASFVSENTIKLFSELGNQASDYIQDCVAKFKNRGKNGTSTKSKTSESGDKNTGKEYVGLILGLTTSDTESYDITIPRKKVEDGSDYTTHLLPQAFKKDFNVILTNKVLSTDYNRTLEIENIEKVKDKLIEIAQSRILFDIYIRLSADKCYKRSNVYFSSISFTKDEGSGNNYTCSFSVEPITTFKAKTFVSNRKYFPTASKTQNSGTSTYKSSHGSGANSYRSGKKNAYGGSTSNGYKLKIEHLNRPQDEILTANSLKEARARAKQQGKHLYIRSDGPNQSVKYVKNEEIVRYNGALWLKDDIVSAKRVSHGYFPATPQTGFKYDKHSHNVVGPSGYKYHIYE